jgi:glucan 1,3-beta-glucosidase
MMRAITGIGSGNGPYISIHEDGSGGLTSSAAGFMPGSDRVILDIHTYFAFSGSPNTEPINTGTGAGAGGVWPGRACNGWGPNMNTSQALAVTIAGEFSAGYNDCGLFVRGVGSTPVFGGDCAIWDDSSNWNASTKAGVKAFVMASMDALQNWYFWTWKVTLFSFFLSRLGLLFVLFVID